MAPGHSWTSFAAQVNYELPVHKDIGSGPLRNAVIALSHFEGGELWLEDESGHVYQEDQNRLRRGSIFSLHDAMTYFPSHSVAHCTLQSVRFVWLTLVAYTVRNFLNLDQQWHRALHDIGFPLPAEGDLNRLGQGCYHSSCIEPASGTRDLAEAVDRGPCIVVGVT